MSSECRTCSSIGSQQARNFDVSDEGIRIACLCPSFVRGGMFREELTQLDSTLASAVEATGLIEYILPVNSIITKLCDSLLLFWCYDFRIDHVADAFHKLVTDEFNNGGVLVVSPRSMEYKHPRRLRPKL